MKKEWLALAVILLAALSAMIYYGDRKQGYHVDELYSYGLANSEYLPFMHFGVMDYSVKDWMMEYGAGESVTDLGRNLFKDYRILKADHFNWRDSVIYGDYLRAQSNSADLYTTTWVPGKAYRDYLAVAPENTFNYASVYYNQRGDVHPPLFYIALHTVCSFFPGTFSKWFCLGLNMLFMLATLVVIWHMACRHLGGGKVLPLVLTASYALSCGFITTAIFLRMYALLTLMVLLCLNAHLELVHNDFKMDRKTGWGLALTTFFGYLTHYYFVIYVLLLALVVFLWMLLRKQWRDVRRYVFTMAGTAAVGIAIWPFSLKHVFTGYRGRQSLDVIREGRFSLLKLRWMSDYIFAHMLGDHKWVALAALVFLAVAVVIRKKFPWGKAMMLLIPVVGYVTMVSQIVPYLDDRYIMCTYPFLCVFLVCGVAYGARILLEKKQKLLWIAPALMALVMISCNLFVFHMPLYLYEGEQETVYVPGRCVSVFVLPDGDWNESARESSILAQCEKVAVVYASSLDCLEGTYEYEQGQNVMVTVPWGLNAEETVAQVLQVLGNPPVEEQFRREDVDNVKIYLGMSE